MFILQLTAVTSRDSPCTFHAKPATVSEYGRRCVNESNYALYLLRSDSNGERPKPTGTEIHSALANHWDLTANLAPQRLPSALSSLFVPPPPLAVSPSACPQLELANHHFQGAAAAAAELAFPGGTGETEEQRNRFLVLRLYEALNAGDAWRAQELLAPDLEWWFHGPPARQHMMRLLTGAEAGGFAFFPRSVDAFGSTVIAEGADDARQLYWVHAWTVGDDGVITQLREYFNTDLTVTLLSAAAATTTTTTANAIATTTSSSGPISLWQSRLAERAHKSLPGLVLAI
ncbi:hypothetical protein EJB05_06975, partial [Eragrostis curvula]